MSNEVRIRATVKDEASKEVEGIAKRVKGFASGIGNGIAIMSGLGVAGFLALGKSSLDMASDYNEARGKAKAVFGGMSADIERFAADGAKNLGLNKAAVLDFAGSFGNMFDQLRIGQRESAEMSKSIIQLAADFGSYHNADITDVVNAQSSAFRGEYDAVQRFLPLLNAATVETKALEMTGKENAKQLNQQDKALATYKLMLEGVGAAQGNYAETAKDSANMTRTLDTTFDNLRITIGQKLQPVYKQVIGDVLQTVEDPAFEQGVARWTGSIVRFGEGFVKTASFIVSNKTALVASIAAIAGAFLLFNPAIATLAAIGFGLTRIGQLGQGNGFGGGMDLQGKVKELEGMRNQRLGLNFPPSAAREVFGMKLPAIAGPVAPTLEENAAAAERAALENLKLTTGMGDMGDAAKGAKEKILTLAEALEDRVLDYAEALELKLTPAMAGAEEAATFLAGIQHDANEETFEYGKRISKLNALMAAGGDAADKYRISIGRENLEKLKAATSAINGRPTQEQAALHLQIAQLEAGAAGQTVANLGFTTNNEPRKRALEGEVQNLQLQKQRAEAMKQDTTVLDNLIGMRERELTQMDGMVEQFMKPWNEQREKLEANLRVLTATHDLQEAQNVAADKTLLTESERESAMREVNGLTREHSELQRGLVRSFHDLLPELESLRRTVQGINGTRSAGSAFGASATDVALADRGVAFTPPGFAGSGGIG